VYYVSRIEPDGEPIVERVLSYSHGPETLLKSLQGPFYLT
jgi:hypothetical protein